MPSLRTITRGAAKRLTAPVLASVPLQRWPPAIGRLHGVRLPHVVRRYPAPTATCPSNLNVLLDLLDEVRAVPGAIAECGVYRGETLVAMALQMRRLGQKREFYGFDSFEGFGASIQSELPFERSRVNVHMKATGYSNTSRELVQEKCDVFGLRNVHLVQGFFSDTLTTCAADRFAFVHLDCDTYSAYLECLAYFYPRLSPGAIVVFDEYDDAAWPGCNAAVDEFLRDKPETLRSIARDRYVKSYIVREAG